MLNETVYYVLYDNMYDIKVITPSIIDNTSEYSIANISLSEVNDFLIGRKNPSDYQIRKVNDKFLIQKKEVNIIYTRSVDNYLTEINNIVTEDVYISIINQVSKKCFIVEALNVNNIDDFIRIGKLSIHITKKHDPHFLLTSLNFSTEELFFKKKLYFEYNNEYKNVSAYTKKVIGGYSYKENYGI